MGCRLREPSLNPLFRWILAILLTLGKALGIPWAGGIASRKYIALGLGFGDIRNQGLGCRVGARIYDSGNLEKRSIERNLKRRRHLCTT